MDKRYSDSPQEQIDLLSLPRGSGIQDKLSEADLDNLQWAKEFMDKYEKRKKISGR